MKYINKRKSTYYILGLFLSLYIIFINTELSVVVHNYLNNISDPKDCSKYENMNAIQVWNKFKDKSNYTKFEVAYFLSKCGNKNGIYLTYKLYKDEYNSNYDKSPLALLHLQFNIPIPPNYLIQQLLSAYVEKIPPVSIDTKEHSYWGQTVIELTNEDPGPI